jgi:signal transduction histidine kinase
MNRLVIDAQAFPAYQNGAFGVLPDKAAGLLEIAYRNTNRLIILVNDILDMEKIVSGNMEFEFKRLNLSTLVTEAVKINQGYAEEDNVSFIFVDVAPDVMVNGDDHRLDQVMVNLLSNAAKFSPDGGKVEISVVSHKVS